MSQTIKQQNDSLGSNNDEEILYVPKEMIEHPLGFVVDAGGSVTKVVYRSKKDYSAGKPLKSNPNHGILRLRYFDMRHVTDIIDFLRENCDMIIEDGNEWWITGITTQHFKKNLDSTLRIKTKLFSEMMALGIYFKHFDQMNTGCFETDLEAVKYVKETGNTYLKLFKELEELEDTTIHSNFQESDENPVESNGAKCPFNVMDTPAMKLLSGNAEDWAKEYLDYSGKMEYPILLVHMGSAIPIGMITEDRQFQVVDFLSGMGKMLCGLSEELIKEPVSDGFQEYVSNITFIIRDKICSSLILRNMGYLLTIYAPFLRSLTEVQATYGTRHITTVAILTGGGQPFSTEGHIENSIVIGEPHTLNYIMCTLYNAWKYKLMTITM